MSVHIWLLESPLKVKHNGKNNQYLYRQERTLNSQASTLEW